MRIVSNANVEDVCLAVGDVVGHENIVSASRMNNAFVLFFFLAPLRRQTKSCKMVL